MDYKRTSGIFKCIPSKDAVYYTPGSYVQLYVFSRIPESVLSGNILVIRQRNNHNKYSYQGFNINDPLGGNGYVINKEIIIQEQLTDDEIKIFFNDLLRESRWECYKKCVDEE